MLSQATTICFNESDHITLQSIMNIVTGNGAKITHKMPQHGFKLLLPGIYEKRVVTGTPQQIL